MLRGLQAAPPPERWVLWGPPEVAAHTWPGAEHVTVTTRPTQLSGQRELLGIPRADLAVFLHQQRPLRPVPALTTILDTTPLRYNRNRLDGWAKAQFLRQVARTSKGILTISEFSRRCIQDDLGVPAAMITTIGLPADREHAARVLAQREALPPEDLALYVGLFLPHKNLRRLIEAFGRTSFRRDGGRLLLVGGKDRAEPLRQSLDAEQADFVTIRATCTQAELERLYATARLLVQPSLEEGFGLPVQEALACGLPAAVSTGGALPEVTAGFAEHFDPRSVEAMTDAIDRTAARAAATTDHGRRLSTEFLATTPTIAQLAEQVQALVRQHI